MATNDQNDFPLPDGSNDRRQSSFHLPKYFRTEVNNKFLSSTFDQLIQPGVVEKINGYIGRKESPAFRPDDFYIGDVSKQREDYQLEPAVVIKDAIDNVDFYKDYNDYINQIFNIGGDTSDHSLLNRQEYYAWNPHIDWDKFVNFREYYWLPNGPDPVPIAGQTVDVQTTYTVNSVDNQDNYAFVFTPDGLTQNPDITLYRGVAYRFEIDSPGVPISFRTQRLTAREWTPYTFYSTGETVLYESKIYIATQDHRSDDTFREDIDKWDSNEDLNLSRTIQTQGLEQGVIEFTLDENSPDFIYYVSDVDINAGGLIRIYDLEEAAFIDVEKEILGKQTYKTGQGFDLTNGQKVYFQGQTNPVSYQEGNYYVEGVGEKIVLIPESELTTPTDFLNNEQIEFDTEAYDATPYSTAIGFAREKDYFTINRASSDGNLWSKYNRWCHRDIILSAAEINGTEVVIDQSQRATRPIIEFEAGLKLFNFGTQRKNAVDLVDDFTRDVFSIIEGSTGYSVDGVRLTEGMRVLFTADTDIFVSNKIFTVTFIQFKGQRQIALIETDDTEPLENETILVKQGNIYKGKIVYFNGEEWQLAQEKTQVNQPPLFDVFNCNGDSLADKTVYPSSDFEGTRVFSYSIGNSPVDNELGISLNYRNIRNIGDILFRFDLQQDSVTYCPEGSAVQQESTDLGFLQKYNDRTDFVWYNGWEKGFELSSQPVVRQYVVDNQSQVFPIDVYEESGLLEDLKLKVFLDNRLQFENRDYELRVGADNLLEIIFTKTLDTNSIVQIKTRSSQPKTENGLYEIPSNLERNPNNDNFEFITLGEINDHVQSIVSELDEFDGEFPGTSNLRDRGLVSRFGTRIIKHTAPLSLASYHLDQNSANIIKAIRYSKNEYSKFKREFVEIATQLGFEGPTNKHFDEVIKVYVENKPRQGAFFQTDMFASGAAEISTSQISFDGEVFFTLTQDYKPKELSFQSVLVYKNQDQLLYGYDYVITEENFVQLTEIPAIGDEIAIYEFETTNGNFVPATPTKLGLYPLYKPEKFLDDTYIEPREVIQGHDGSITAAYGDFRDDLILELEKRIYNNIKIDYDPSVFDINDYVPSVFRNTGLTRNQIDRSLLPDFINWLSLVEDDYTENNFYQRTNAFTYNYSGTVSFDNSVLQGTWRKIYQDLFDTDRPHSHPWEMLGYSEKPNWWEETYGPAPYTRNNLILWEDLEQGIIRQPGKNIQFVPKYARKNLTSFIPVDSQGNLLPPLKTNYVKTYNSYELDGRFVFGDQSPVETAWRRSSEFPFALIAAFVQNQPNRTFATAWDRSRLFRTSIGELSYNSANLQLSSDRIVFPSRQTDEDTIFASGLINWIRDYIDSDSAYEEYKQNVRNLQIQLGFKLAGFTNKDKLKLLLDSRTPLNQGNVFVPEENYDIFLNTSSPIENIFYSGVYVEKIPEGFIIRGYDQYQPRFRYYRHIVKKNDPVVNVGGVSEPTVEWSERRLIAKGTVVAYQNKFYRALETHTTTTVFDADKFVQLPKVPREGGRDIIVRSSFNRTQEFELNYGTVLENIQDVVDFLLGYGDWLEAKGFVFDYYDSANGTVADWQTSAREFAFWTLQNWSEGAVISLSPGAFELRFRTNKAMVGDIYNTFYGYSLFKVDGKSLDPRYVALSRENENEFRIRTKATEDGIFGVRISLIQKEHAIIIDNRTDFGDIIYDQGPGFRQERIKILGYRTTDWNGSLNIPGFIFDDARVEEWTPWRDYAIGDLVKYKEFYYAAKTKIAGSAVFDANDWQLLDERPESKLLPNFDYKTNQFADFYDLDTDNFDAEQQKFAQHLIGYQNREYLANIINDDVSQYKFYQGFIQDKGTKNALSKLFDPLSSDDKDSLEFYEEWAIKAGQYGAVRGIEEVEFLLDENRFTTDPQSFELVNSIDPEYTGRVVKLLPGEVYLKPEDYEHAIPLERKVIDSYVQNSGYVSGEDVDFTVDRYQDILNIDFVDTQLGSTVWVGNREQGWDVYTLVQSNISVESITESGSQFVLEISTGDIDLEIGEIIALEYSTSDGLYEIEDIVSNSIYISGPDNLEIQEQYAVINRWISARFSSADTISNKIYEVENGLTKLYLDKDINDNWKVLQKTNDFVTKQELVNPNDAENSFGSSFATDSRNTVLVAGSPNDEDGKVFVYVRATASGNYQLAQTLVLQNGIADFGSKFGDTVAVSSNGKWIFVGAPEASNVVSRYQGEFDETRDYEIGDVVQFRDNLWRATAPIQRFLESVPLGSFNSYLQNIIDKGLTKEEDEQIEVLLAGNYPLVSVGSEPDEINTTDHFLVRAPLDQFQGSSVGDQIKAKWNTLSYAYQSVDGLPGVQPFNGDLAGFDASIFTGTLTIADKIDSILRIPDATTIPDVGQTIETSAAVGTIAHVYSIGSDVSIYIKDQNGEFDIQGTAITGIGQFIGSYERVEPVEETADFSDTLGGFWKIQVSQNYEVNGKNSDTGRGLIIYDFIPQGGTDENRFYENILDYQPPINSGPDNRYSEITTLTYEGFPGPYNEQNFLLESDLFVVRAPTNITNQITPGDEIDLFFNYLPNYETGTVKDITQTGLAPQDLNKTHTVEYVWDGYIDITILGFEAGRVVEPYDIFSDFVQIDPITEQPIPLIIQDQESQGTAEVVFYQKFNTDDARIYVRNIQGEWGKGREFVENRTIIFLADGSGDSFYDPDSGFRTIGQLDRRSFPNDNEGIGKLLVFKRETPVQIESVTQPRLLESEYWFYREDTVFGSTREANIPTAINIDWDKVFGVEASIGGDASGLTNEGLVSIYERTGKVEWTNHGNYIVPDRKNENKFGSEIQSASIDGLEKIFVKADENKAFLGQEYGKIYSLKQGNANGFFYDWELCIDKNYAGEYVESADTNDIIYTEGDVVFYENKLYRALTNIPAKPFDSTEWQELSTPIDYLGYIPNDSGLDLTDSDVSILDTTGLQQFARDFAVSQNGEILVVSLVYNNRESVVIYRNLNDLYIQTQILESESADEEFGSSVTISDNGKFIAIGAPDNSDDVINQGKVYVYQQIDEDFEKIQSLVGPSQVIGEKFGSTVYFSDNLLAVRSINANASAVTTFDNTETTFDRRFTNFVDEEQNTGLIRLYQLVDERILYFQSVDYDSDAKFFGQNIRIVDDILYAALPQYSSDQGEGLLLEYKKQKPGDFWQIEKSIKPTININKIKQVILYNVKTNQLVQYLDYIDPLQGKIPGVADQEIDFKMFNDPATYTNGTAGNINSTNSWNAKQVGKIWWDLSNARFVNPYQENITYSANNWNTLFSDENSIDVYEWVESDLLPSEWDARSGTEQGFAQGITGETRYGDSAYAEKKIYDEINKSISSKYYYWVRNKSTVPVMENRSLSAFDISQLIANPAGQGYRFVAFISPTQFAIYNCSSLINDNDIALGIQYYTIDNQQANIHNQYQIVTENLPSSRPSRDVEAKWFDSLVGYDQAQRAVPDPALNPKIKYGVLNRPRQGWFVNRIEALKQLVERVNSVLERNLIVDEKDITALDEKDAVPSVTSNRFDRTVESEIDLDLIGVVKAERAQLNPIIENGRITDVEIVSPGRSYQRPPTLEIVGNGTGAQISIEIDKQGRVVTAEVVEEGEYYSSNTTILVRPYAVLVENDSTIGGKWAIYQRNAANTDWNRVSSQAYDVTRYWQYRDWYAEGYNRNTEIDFLINSSYELFALNDSIGDIVKIKNINSGGWLLLEKTSNLNTIDYTQNYKTIGRQNGTIEILESLYNTTASLTGYDVTNFDSINFDAIPITETRIILETIRDQIFTDNLAIEYNKLFFASLRYVFAEQNYVDWAFKTSFVKAKHNVGKLEQKLTFSNDNLASYEKYVREVKPYKTKIREYLSSYENQDNSQTVTTDFDLNPRFKDSEQKILPFKTRIRDNQLQTNEGDISQAPYSNWLSNFTYKVIEIDVVDAGEGYTNRPVVQITGGGGDGASAQASLGPNGTVSQISIITQGEGYLSPPTVTILGSIEEGGREARAIARIGDNPVRSASLKIKFDRVSGEFEFVNLNTVQTFTGSGFRQEFDLDWPMDLRTDRIAVFINDNPQPRGTFSVENRLDRSKSYDRYLGRVTIDPAPANASTVRIEYRKSVDILKAADRINFEYEPQQGQLGKYIGQLMDGVDYGGVEVTGFDFSGQTGWDSQGWFAQPWDVFDTSFEDEIIELDGSTILVELSAPLESSVVYNIYRIARDSNGKIVSNVRMDDPNFGTPQQTNQDAVCESIVGDGSTTIIELDEINIPTTPQNSAEDIVTIVIRKITSDGSFIPDPDSFDVSLSGGNLNYSNAQGIAAEEIEVDGDGFVTETNSKGPEEIVPGQLQDTLDIQVYESPASGSSPISVRNFMGTGSRREFEIGSMPVNENAVFIKVDQALQDSQNYVIDYINATVVFDEAPAEDTIVNIVNFGNAGSSIFDIEQFRGDGETGEFLLPVDFNEDIEVFATVNGVEKSFELQEADETYDSPGSAVVKFASPPQNNSFINILIAQEAVRGSNISVVRLDEFVADGSTTQFTLANDIFQQQPAVNYVLVFVNDTVLNAVYNKQFVIEAGVLSYQLDVAQIPSNTTDPRYLEVYLNDNLLEYPGDYTFDSTDIPGVVNGNVINLVPGVAQPGDTLDVYVMNTGDYRFGFIDQSGEFITQRGEDSTFPVLNLDSAYSEGDKIRVYSFGNHDSQNIERQLLTVNIDANITEGTEQWFANQQLSKGVINLTRPASRDTSVWCVKNGKLLNMNIDYSIVNSGNTVKLSEIPNDGDVIEVIHFANRPVNNLFGWRQFKDILNRNHYKRIGKKLSLAQDLHWNDKEIHIEDATELPSPSYGSRKPGIIFIEGERIEYFVKNENILTQLRRGTLGTGVKDLYPVGTMLVEQGSSQNLPYQDETQTVTVESGGYNKGLIDYENSPGVSITDIRYDFNNNSAFPLGGQVATVTGSGFRENVTVFVGETECETNYIDANSLTFITPELPVGSYDLIVVNPATTVPLNVAQTSAVAPGLVKYLQILLPYAPQPDPESEENWFKQTEEISVSEIMPGRGYKISESGNTDFISIGSANNSAGTEFVATGAGTGTGKVINYTSIPYEYWEAQDIEVFVAGRRLRKKPVQSYNYQSLDSPEGDIDIEAEFAVNKNIGQYVRLTEAPPAGVTINVVRKTGSLWSAPGTPLSQAQSEITEFLLAETTQLPR
jgi:hypothetical protein